jgi:hypothetical protein
MAEQFSTEVVKRSTREIASRLSKAAALATSAQTLSSQGLTEHAFDRLTDVEPLIFQVTACSTSLPVVSRAATENTS